MPVYSIIRKSQIEGAKRIDAEYFQPQYLEVEKILLQTNSHILWKNIDGRFVTGPFGSEFNVDNYTTDTNYRYIRGKDVKEFFLLDVDNVFIPENDFNRLKKYSLKEGDILISVVGTLGNVSIVDHSVPPAIFSCKSTAFRTDSINTYYLLAYLNSKYGKGLLERNVRGAVQTGLNIDDLKTLPIFVPLKENQKTIASIVIKAKKEFDFSKSLYSQAENLLLEELDLKDFKPQEDLSYVVNLSDIKSVHRADAEYFQPKYEKLIGFLGKDKQSLNMLAKRKSKRIKLIPENPYRYIEISNIDIGCGEVSFNIMQGHELPANAKIKIEGGELIVSKVRPTRGGVGIVPEDWDNNFVASGAFSVFEVPSPTREYLQVVLRTIIGKLQLEKPTTGSSYPTVDDEDVEKLLIPVLPEPIQQRISALVHQSHEARKKAKGLLEEAKRKVEEAIEGK